MKVKLVKKEQYFQLIDARGRSISDVNRFLKTLYTRGLSPHTARAYAYDLQSFLSWLSVPSQVHSLKIDDLYKFIEQQQIRKLSPRSINRKLSTIVQFYQFVTGKELQANILCSGYRARKRDRNLGIHRLPRQKQIRLRVKVPKKLITPLNTDQVKFLLQQFSRYRDLALCYLMVLCGLRTQEVLNIQCEDLRMPEKKLCVHGKGNKERILPLPDVILGLVEKYRIFERPTECATNALFVVLQGQRRGQPMTIAGVRSLFRVKRKHSQLANIHPHLLRHTFGSTMAASGMSLLILQRMMGHAFPDTTMKYINLSMNDVVEQFRQATERVTQHYLQK